MKKVILYIASSLDGYIARPDGNLDWLLKYPINPNSDYGYGDLMNSIDTVIMGGKTYRDILNMDMAYPYADKISYIVTRNKDNEPKNKVHFVGEEIIEMVSKMRGEQGKNIWLVGGGELIALFLNYNLIDKIIITIIPTLLGEGIRLFPNFELESEWKLIKNEGYDNSLIQIEYQRQYKNKGIFTV